MIKRWEVRNFKGIEQAALELRPLTILSGENSSGKSTILQSMALVAQTLAAHLDADTLILNGHLASLGEFDDIVPQHNPDAELSVAWTLQPYEPVNSFEGLADVVPLYDTRTAIGLREVSCQVAFGHTEKHGRAHVTKGMLRAQPLDDSETISEISWSGSGANCSAKVDALALKELQQSFPRSSVNSVQLRHFLPSRMLLEVEQGLQDAVLCAECLCQTRKFYRADRTKLFGRAVPEAILTELGRRSGSLLSGVLEARREWSFAALSASIAARVAAQPELQKVLLESVEPIIEALRSHQATVVSTQSAPLPGRLPDAVSHVESFFATQFRYLGPLRDEPRSVYPYPTKVDPIELGRRGEFTAAAYHAYKSTPVDHIRPEDVRALGPLAPVTRAPLSEAVTGWLSYIGVSTNLQTNEQKYGHVFGVSTAGGEFEMLHVGTGVSQVLPIIVLGLLAQPGDTVAIEHPELHLHPAVQSRLADFFLFLALTGRQSLVETHSEHIINRLRRRIVDDPSNAVRDAVTIYFASRETGDASFEEIRMDEFGAIANWPSGFFDEAAIESEAIIRAAIGRRNAVQG